MNEKSKVIVAGFLVAGIFGLLFFAIVALVSSVVPPSMVEISQLLMVPLQINVVLYGFSMLSTVYMFIQRENLSKLAIMFSSALLISYFVSFLLGFLCLVYTRTLSLYLAYLPFAFTLSGLLATICFLYATIAKESESNPDVPNE